MMVNGTHPTERELSGAYVDGQRARQAGKPREPSNGYGTGRHALLAEAWCDGWDSEDRARRERRR